jgi:hypothetical protein
VDEPVFREERGGVLWNWYCDPPDWGASFRVIRGRWDIPPSSSGLPLVRHVYEVRQDGDEDG